MAAMALLGGTAWGWLQCS